MQCGVNTGLAGFSAPDDKGDWTGLDVDFCRAVAAAVFGDGTKVKFTPLSAKERFTALQSGEIDVLSRNTTWTINRDTALGLNFAGVNYYDGQGFMINAKKLRASTRRCSSPAPRSACRPAPRPSSTSPTTSRPTTWNTTRSSSRSSRRSTPPTMPAAATSTPPTSRASTRIRLTLTAPDDHVVLPEIISKEPLGPAVRQGDDQWFDIVKWTYYALLTPRNSASPRPMSRR